MIDVNLKGVLYGVAAALPHMIEQKSGHIINLSSVAGHKLFGGSAVYSATKFAVRALSEGLRQEMAAYNIRTTIISPGAVKTELLDHITEKDVQQANQDYVAEVGVPAETFARLSLSPSTSRRMSGPTRSFSDPRRRSSEASGFRFLAQHASHRSGCYPRADSRPWRPVRKRTFRTSAIDPHPRLATNVRIGSEAAIGIQSRIRRPFL